jgi:hypothetical protein
MDLRFRTSLYLLVGLLVTACLAMGCPSKPDSSYNGDNSASASDSDEDGVRDASDNCHLVYNPGQRDTDEDGSGNACDPNDDGDIYVDEDDNCPLVVNPFQLDTDGDGKGDECDEDIDDDTILNEEDNCPALYNPDQDDLDADGLGDVCDEDLVLPTERGFKMFVSPNAPGGFSAVQTISLVSTMSDGIVISHVVDWDGTEGTYEILENLVTRARQNGLEVTFAVEVAVEDFRRKLGPFPESFTDPRSPDFIPPAKRNFENETLREIIKDWCLRLAGDFKPEYMMVGVETNMYYFPNLLEGDTNPDGENFVSLYAEIYKDIKGTAPETTVFTTFQWDQFRVLELIGLTSFLEEHWDYVEMFDGYLDLFAISSFPASFHITPESVPDDYFAMIQERIDIPVALAETGWPSSGEGSVYINEEAQSRFVYRILEITESLDLRLMNWFFLSDPPRTPGLLEQFYSSGLLYEDGKTKQAFNTWQELFTVEFAGSTAASNSLAP